MNVVHLKERVVVGKRLGRHIEHDPDSRAYAIDHAPSTPLVSAFWRRHGGPFDQGELGSCTANAGLGVLMTGPFYNPSHNFKEADCVSVYSEATTLDNIEGHFPPDDTGSTGLAVCKAMKRRGLIRGYRHTFGLHAALVSLSHYPLMVGMPWYEGGDTPSPDGEISDAGEVRGGHEVEAAGIDVPNERVWFINSWGRQYGVAHPIICPEGGCMWMSFAAFGRILSRGGDVAVPVQ